MGVKTTPTTASASGIWTLRSHRDYVATLNWSGTGNSPVPPSPPSGDPLYSQVVALLHFNDAEYSTTFVDSSRSSPLYGNYFTANAGSAVARSNNSKYGGRSCLVSGTNSGLYCVPTINTPQGLFWIEAAEDFTIEFWLNVPALPLYAVTLVANTSPESCGVAVGSFFGFSIKLDYNQVYFDHTCNNSAKVSGNISANAWNHIAVSRSLTALRMFVNGQKTSEVFDSSQYYGDNRYLALGGVMTGGAFGLGGWIDDFRFTKGAGAARYTANFTPPASQFPDSL